LSGSSAALEPDNFLIINSLAWLMAISPEKDHPAVEALEFAQRASLKYPNELSFRLTLGIAQCRAGQFTESLRNLTEADQKTPPIFPWRAHNLLFQALCQLKLGNRLKAQAAYDKALELLKQAEGDTSIGFEEARLLQKEVESLLNPSGTDHKK